MKKQSRFQIFVEYLFDNLFDIATIVVAGYLVVRHQVQPFAASDIAELLTWILAVLGLIAVSGLWDRNRRLQRIQNVAEESRDLVLRRVSGRAQAGDFFSSNKRLSEETFVSANTIFISGMTLVRTTREYNYILGERLRAEANIRIIILEPQESLLQELVSRSSDGTTIDYWKNRIQTVETLVGIIANTPNGKGKLELGYLPYIPSFGFVMTDPDERHGFCFVELYHHKSPKTNPFFELRASEDQDWYTFFREQYELLWNSCRKVTFDDRVVN